MAKFNRFICYLLILLLLSACNSTKIYLVRHAEKSAEPKENPPLTAEGMQRAEALSALLKDKKIKAIYSTATTRTLETAGPLSKATGIPVQEYKNDTLQKFLNRVLDSQANSVIVGHSNTTISMLNILQLQHQIAEISDNDYDNLFIITLKSKNKAGYKLSLKETTYGKTSPAPGDTTKPVMKMR